MHEIVEEYKLPHFHLVLDGTVALTKPLGGYFFVRVLNEYIRPMHPVRYTYVVNDLNISICLKTMKL